MNQPLSLISPFIWLENQLIKFFDNRFWRFRLLALSLLIALGTLLLFNSIYLDIGGRGLYNEIRRPGTQENYFWDDIIRQAQNPFRSFEHSGPVPHEANLAFRLTIPLLTRLLGLNIAELYAVQLLLGALFLWVVSGKVFSILDDKPATFYFMTGFTAIYAGIAFFINFYGHCDGYTFCFMALAFCFPKPLTLLLFSQLAFWCDERAVINATYMGLWFLLPVLYDFDGKQPFSFRRIPVSFVTLLVSISLYAVVRKLLEWNLNLSVGHDTATSIVTLKWSLSIFGDKMMRGLEGMWLLFFAAFWALYARRRWVYLLFFAGSWAVTMLVANLVADGTRSLSYGFIAFFLVLYILKRELEPRQLKYLLVIGAVISLMLPIAFP